MAESIIKIGAIESPITLKKTNAEVSELLSWLIKDKTPPEGLTQTQLNKWKLDEAHKRILQLAMREIRERQLAEERTVVMQDYQTKINALKERTALTDEPETPTLTSAPIPPPGL